MVRGEYVLRGHSTRHCDPPLQCVRSDVRLASSDECLAARVRTKWANNEEAGTRICIEYFLACRDENIDSLFGYDASYEKKYVPLRRILEPRTDPCPRGSSFLNARWVKPRRVDRSWDDCHIRRFEAKRVELSTKSL